MFVCEIKDYCSTHPIVPSAVVCACGCAAGLSLPLWSLTPVLWLTVFLAPALVAACWILRRRPLGACLSAMALAALCSLFYAQRADIQFDTAAENLAAIAETNSRCVVTGEVTSVRSPSKASYGESKFRFSIRNCAVKFEGREDFQPLVRPLAIVWYGREDKAGAFVPEKGLAIETKVKICRRKKADPSSRDINDYFAVGRQSTTKGLPVAAGEPGILERWRRISADRIARGLEKFEEEKSLLHAMMFGYRSKIPSKTNAAFRHAGTIHIFAISGLHVLLIARILKNILSYAGVTATWMIFPLMPLLAFYIMATGGQPSAIRAGVMCFFYYAAPLFGRRPDSLNSVSLSALALLAFDPLQLRELGFILSFSMVVGLILFGSRIHRLVSRLFRYGRQIDYISLRESAFAKDEGGFCHAGFEKKLFIAQKYLVKCEGKTIGFLSTAVTASLVSLPLTSYYFGYFTTFSFIANIGVVFLAEYTLFLAGIGLLASCLLDVLAVPFNLAAAILTLMMKKISFWCVSLPGSTPYAELPIWGVALWYLALTALLKWNWRKGKS